MSPAQLSAWIREVNQVAKEEKAETEAANKK
jgi:hypothetical protein